MNLEQQLLQRLQQLDPEQVEIINESFGHAGYYPGKETHFKVVVVSDVFEKLRLVQRHQTVYAQVSDLLTTGGGKIHALAIHAYTPQEWEGQAPDSPQCAHAPKR